MNKKGSVLQSSAGEQWLYERVISSIPGDPVGSICKWGKEFVKLPGSAMSKTFDPDLTPWIKEPLDSQEDPGRQLTNVIFCIQSGKSVIGEVRLCHIIATKSGGDIQYNWQNDDQADARWEKRLERILTSCVPVMGRWPKDRHKAKRGLILFPHCNFTMQGVFTNRNVASDSIKYQVNEEVHDEEGWMPGRLEQAFGRTTAYWDRSVMVISNAGRKGSELHIVSGACAQKPWMVLCPGCGKHHVMRTEWKDHEPHQGGLRYDAEGCRRPGNEYDYDKLKPTIRYQMPCGFPVKDEDKATRRQMSLGGKYPDGNHARVTYSLEAVSVDYISFLDLIIQKHRALKAMRYGDLGPWRKYMRERECKFASDEDRPFYGRVVLSDKPKKREGLPNRLVRFGSLDHQEGEIAKGELPHWWGMIADFEVKPDGSIHFLLVFEGKLETDEQAAAVMKLHEVEPCYVVADSGHDAVHVYKFCLQHGFNAIKGGGDRLYSHPDGSGRIYSPEKPLHSMINAPPKYEPVWNGLEWIPHRDEPMFWIYSQQGIANRDAWLANGGGGMVTFEIPSDVSDDYKEHIEAEELQERINRYGKREPVWVQIRPRNDLLICRRYIAMLAEISGIIGIDKTIKDEKTDNEKAAA